MRPTPISLIAVLAASTLAAQAPKPPAAMSAIREADLKDATLRYSDLRCAKLQGADLTGADLHRALLRSAHFSEATRWPASYNPRKHGAGVEKRKRGPV